jgi:hypothetical protein
MSFSIGQISTFVGFAILTIGDYTNGGEQVSVASLNFPPNFLGADLGTVPSTKNSLGVPLFPVLEGAKVKLFRFVSGSPVEIPTTAGLNAQIPVTLGWS